MKNYKRYNCILDLGQSYLSQSIICERLTIKDDTMFFYDADNEIVACTPTSKTFVISMENLNNNLEF